MDAFSALYWTSLRYITISLLDITETYHMLACCCCIIQSDGTVLRIFSLKYVWYRLHHRIRDFFLHTPSWKYKVTDRA